MNANEMGTEEYRALTDGPEGHKRVVDGIEIAPFLLLGENERADKDKYRCHAELDGNQFEAGDFLPLKAQRTLQSRENERDDRIQSFTCRLKHDEIQRPRHERKLRTSSSFRFTYTPATV